MIDFYNNLSSNGLFFFWIVVFLFVFVLFLVVVLLLKNRKLSKYLKEKNINKEDFLITKEVLDNPIIEKSISEKVKENINLEISKTEEKDRKYEISKEEVKEEKTNNSNGLYKKNVLREVRKQTSPIGIGNGDRDTIREEYSYSEDIDINGIDYNKDNLSPLNDLDDVYEVNDSMKFASDIVEKMEEEIKPSNIELTDYERKQEEEAIISYDELLKVKDKIYNITDDEETDEFIEEIKSLRTDLQ